MNIALKQLTRIASLTLFTALFSLSLAAQAAQPLKGQWLISPSGKADSVQFTFSYSRSSSGHNFNSVNSDDMPTNVLVGLTPGDLHTDGAHVQFKVVRPAGTFACEGWMRKGEGSGHFDFVPDRGYSTELKRRNIGEPSDEQLMRLAFSNTTLAFIDEMKGMGYALDLDQLIRVSDHGVTPEYMHGLQTLGIKPPSVERLVRMHDHGVSIAYIKEMMALGYKGLDEEQLVRLSDHGVRPNFVREIRALGFENLDAEQLTRLRDHGVSPEFAKEVKSNYREVTAEQLIRMKDHGVTASYLQSNIKGRSVEEVIRMHDRGGHMD